VLQWEQDPEWECCSGSRTLSGSAAMAAAPSVGALHYDGNLEKMQLRYNPLENG